MGTQCGKLAIAAVMSLPAAVLAQSESRASTGLDEGHVASNGDWIAYSTAPATDQSAIVLVPRP